MAFEWDTAKNVANIAKHGIDFEDAIRIFEGPVLESPDERREYSEVRIHRLWRSRRSRAGGGVHHACRTSPHYFGKESTLP
jgi:uncharacterized DUF497 family protein